jgi:dolichol-phosphate mannosyltransferase
MRMLKTDDQAPGSPMPEAMLAGPEISIIVPTFNERGNVEELVRRIALALPGVAWEVVVVATIADGMRPRQPAGAGRPAVRCIQRIGRRGLPPAPSKPWRARAHLA